jgi:hypothetical protein
MPPYSPDLNPIEMTFSELRALLRKKAARTFEALCGALADICDLVETTRCRSVFSVAQYEADQSRRASVPLRRRCSVEILDHGFRSADVLSAGGTEHDRLNFSLPRYVFQGLLWGDRT